jgi:hypothetical protein
VTWTSVLTLLAALLASGVLTTALYSVRWFGLPDKSVPPVAHAVAIGTSVLIVILNKLVGSNGHLTGPVIVSAVLLGIMGAFTSSGIHSQTKQYGTNLSLPPPKARIEKPQPVPKSPPPTA